MNTNKKKKTLAEKRVKARLLGIVTALLPEKRIFNPIELGRYVQDKWKRFSKVSSVLEKTKNDFPIFARYKKAEGKELIYLDSAASSQTPKQVVEAMDEYYFGYRSNVHRSPY